MSAEKWTVIRFVRPSIADASTIGDGQYPSSAPWCSARNTVSKPAASAIAHCSTAAGYSSAAGAPNAGARMS